jgi:catechol 2,3-dioxygenase-like lactoylglutathione lyase family enzyme
MIVSIVCGWSPAPPQTPESAHLRPRGALLGVLTAVVTPADEGRSGRSSRRTGHTQTTQPFGADSARPADNHSVIIEFRVDDVDSEYERLEPLVDEWVQQPTTMPWGNRSILFRDPDGNLVNVFTPVTEDAIKKLER